ncbi:hypothetical protein QCE73_13475, partial [Caballeronia sp. LZ029]|uniref:hypothetical protein n=1 Tax=Caballeronia sp. LZ029 TaxID=3038564 RepID=UPI002864925C
YRLLVFKEHIARALPPQLPSCVAASAAEKRDYEESFSPCQQYFLAFASKSADFGGRLFRSTARRLATRG